MDRHRNINLLEGAFIWDVDNSSENGSADDCSNGKTRGEEYIGQNVYDVFFRSNSGRQRADGIPQSLNPIEDILTGKTMEDVQEHCIENRWYRTRFVPVLGKKDSGGSVNEACESMLYIFTRRGCERTFDGGIFCQKSFANL